MPSSESARIWRESLPSIVAAFVVSIAGGGAGTYIGYRIIEYRVADLEKRADKIELRDKGQDDELAAYKSEVSGVLSEIKSDVSYIRGKLERGN